MYNNFHQSATALTNPPINPKKNSKISNEGFRRQRWPRLQLNRDIWQLPVPCLRRNATEGVPASNHFAALGAA